MLALPLPWMTTDDAERRRVLEAVPRLRVGLEQERQALDLREASDVEQDGAPAKHLEISLVVGHPRPVRRNGGGALDEVAAPMGEPVDLEGPEHRWIEAVRQRHELLEA